MRTRTVGAALLLAALGWAACDDAGRVPQGPRGSTPRGDAAIDVDGGAPGVGDGAALDAVVSRDDAGRPLDGGAAHDGAGSEDTGPEDTGADAGADAGSLVPPGVVAVDFAVDDRANRSYAAGLLRWKGAFVFDPTTAHLTPAPDWRGPYPELWDDGGVELGGHEPPGARAGDHVWGVRAYVARPAADQVFEYGLEGGPAAEPRWIWSGRNGTFTVPAVGPDVVMAQGFTVPAWGTRDLRLSFDVERSAPALGLDGLGVSVVEVKSSAWGWALLPLLPTTPGRFVVVMSAHLGAGTSLPHHGRLLAGTHVELVLVVDGREYMDAQRVSYLDGVEAEVQASPGAAWSAVPLSVQRVAGRDGNLELEVP